MTSTESELFIPGVTHLEVNCKGITQLPALPPYVTGLSLSNAETLQSLQPLPPQLGLLSIANTPAFSAEDYASLPKSLKKLYIIGTPLSDIRILPQWIECLILGGTQIKDIPEGLFPNLTKLDIVGDDAIETVCIPKNVVDLRLRMMSRLSRISAFSEKATKMDLEDLPRLTALPSFPGSLRELSLFYIPLRFLPPFPHTDIVVKLSHLNNLPKSLLLLKPTVKDLFRTTVMGEDISQITYTADWITKVNPILKEIEGQVRIRKRCRLIRTELLASAHSPERVAKWLGEGGGNWTLVDTMLGIA